MVHQNKWCIRTIHVCVWGERMSVLHTALLQKRNISNNRANVCYVKQVFQLGMNKLVERTKEENEQNRKFHVWFTQC